MNWPWKKKVPPLCIECRWYRDRVPGYNNVRGCAHPLTRDVVDGDPVFAIKTRGAYGDCKPAGRLFEPKEEA